MDKQSIIGFILIAVLMGAFVWITQPSEEQVAAQKRYQDSIYQVQIAQQIAETQQNAATQEATQPIESDTLKLINDSIKNAQYGLFAPVMKGEEAYTTLENELLELSFSNKGGRIYMARLKNYQTSDSLPLILFDGETESMYGFNIVTSNNRVHNTNELFFTPIKGADGNSITMRLSLEADKYLDFVYTITPDDYMVRYEIKANNMDDIFAHDFRSLDMAWTGKIRQQEKGRTFEDRYAQLSYKFVADDVEQLSESKDQTESPTGKLKWIAFKDQFFSSVLIADEDFSSVQLESRRYESGNYLKQYASKMIVGFDPTGKQATGLRFYLGPNHYATLKAYDNGVSEVRDQLELESLVPLGAWIFRWVNKWLVLPLFNFFGGFIGSYGIIILLLTIVVKLLIFPLTYKSYMSSAKMRVLRAQVEELNLKYPGQEKAMERQKATMALYSRAGASPMSGCVPMLLQMPILIALFQFFPSAIELRQESFLWAKDLSTYDAVISWTTQVPLISKYFGNHISLFCLLMTIVNVFYTKFNMEMTNTGQQQMPGMKYMMYMMPLMFLVFFNQYSSGLTYYYLVSTLFTIIQTLLFRQFINEEKLLAKLEENKKKLKKKSGFMARLEEAQRKQQQAAKQQAKAKRR